MKIHVFAFLALALSSITGVRAADQPTSLIEPGAEVKKLAGDMKFTEGPAWFPATKTVVFSDIPNSKLMQYRDGDGLSVFRVSESSNGNILDLDGRLITCQHAGRNLVRTETDGSITVLVDRFDGKKFNSPNDVAIRSDGTLWFTDPAWGLSGPGELPGCYVYKFDPRTKTVEAVIKDLAMPNGINFSPDESRLYVADTGGNKKNPDAATHGLKGTITCYEVSQEGVLGEKLFVIDHGSDGMAVDVQGYLYTTNGTLKIHDKGGKLVEEVKLPEGPANCTFGGEDMKTLFITAKTSLYSIRTKNPGAKPLGAKW